MSQFIETFKSYRNSYLYLLCLSMLILATAEKVYAQVGEEDTTDASWTVGSRLNTNIAGYGRSLPFWLHAQKNGLYDQRSANGLLYTEFTKPLFKNDQLSIYSSGRFIGRAAEESKLDVHTLSARVNYSFLTFKVGKFLDPIGMNYQPLSSGSMVYSTNAEPVPKMVLQTNGFVNVPLARGYVQFASYLSHGWFEDARYVKNSFLHQKYLYLKVNYKMLEGIGGIVHNVQWGGIHPERGKQPSSLADYWRVLFAKGADEESNAPGGEISNVLGNSVAAYDFNLRINLEQFRLTFYRLFYLEDKVSTRFRSPWDGMWGAGIIRSERNPFLKSLLYEHINTKRQDSFDYEPRGTASYYNNGFYPSGWTYKNRVLGNPLLLTDGTDYRPVYNNIIVAHHLGGRGFLSPNIRWTAYYTFSRNYGIKSDQIIERYPAPRENTVYGKYRPLEELKKVNHSFYVGTSISLPQQENINLQAGMALDLGELYPDRLGLVVGAEYRIY